MDLVSIITPAYNASGFISEMIESVRAQTYSEWELLITDDCSTDNTVEIVRGFIEKDPRIKLFLLQKNEGAGNARNRSIEEAKGRYIAFCDSDDLWIPQKLELQIDAMQKTGVTFLHSNFYVIDSNNNIITLRKRFEKISYPAVFLMDFISTTSCVIYDTAVAGKFYMRPIRKRQDWLYFIDVLKMLRKAYCIQEPLVCWRKHDKSLSSKKRSLFKYHYKVYHEYLKLPAVLAFLVCYGINIPIIACRKIYERCTDFLFKCGLWN
ncbi:MAG: glycosyltransferase [Bacteroidales bacterium]|jgi:glycosyltransferase involved in cell wall biosynthesis|nr:glycosyltransferase [Bacteroidales bacterium]